jgi:type VI secretion system ImpM family protein
MPVASPGASCFGKLPTRGDFVRANAEGRAMRDLDAWMQRGVAEAKRHLGADLAAVFEASGPMCFFIEVPNAPHALAGALRPSRDRSGRRYPFLVAVEIEKRQLDGRRIPSWPHRYKAFYRAAAALVSGAVDGGVAVEELDEALRALRAAYDRTPFPVDYEFCLRQADARDLWARTWGDAEDGRKYVLLKNLTEALAQSGARRSAKLPPLLRIPLPSPAHGLDVSFWLETCWQLLGALPDHAAFFWPPADEGNAELLVAAPPPPPGLFLHLLATDRASSAAPRLDDANGQPAALAALALPARHGTLLEEDTLSLHAFIERMSS